jgi:HAD superfamily hydrolase (TIGR01509 family)
MINKQTISAVIFDMDGLMFDTERIAIQAWQKAGKAFGFTIPESLVIQSIGNNIQATQSLFENSLGKSFDFKQVRKLRIQYAEEMFSQNGIPVKTGLYELLNVLTNYSILKAVATSTERFRAQMMLTQAKVLHHFDTIICGDEVANGKPAPDIFLLVAKRLQVPPKKCIVLEDSEPGIYAASYAQMIPILIPDIKKPSDELLNMAFKTFSNLSEVATYFKNIFQSENREASY